MKGKLNLITQDGQTIQKRISALLKQYSNDRYLRVMNENDLEEYLKNTISRLVMTSIIDGKEEAVKA